MTSKSTSDRNQQILDRGLTSPSIRERGKLGVEKDFYTQSNVTFEGEMPSSLE